MFRDETVAARRNSQRARREGSFSGPSRIGPLPMSLWEGQMQTGDSLDPAMKHQLPWLNAHALVGLPGPLRRDVETRAVDRFFVNWILYPGPGGTSHGHLHNLPVLYQDAQPGSVLWHAVRAVAFADMRHFCDGEVSFSVKARRSYGAALAGIRANVANDQELTTDHLLAALLLVDSFEVRFHVLSVLWYCAMSSTDLPLSVLDNLSWANTTTWSPQRSYQVHLPD
jgi:hypothetical protein